MIADGLGKLALNIGQCIDVVFGVTIRKSACLQSLGFQIGIVYACAVGLGRFVLSFEQERVWLCL